VEPATTEAVGIDTVVVTVPSSEDRLSDARVVTATNSDTDGTMHTIGATTAPGEPTPSCFPAPTRTAWRIVVANDPRNLTVHGERGSGAIAVYRHDLNGNLGEMVACRLVGSGDSVELSFGGPQYGSVGNAAVAFTGYWVELVSGPDPLVVSGAGP
jgi:hypothetical protein